MTSTHPRSTWRWAKLRTARLAIAEANNEPCALCAQAIDYRADRRTRWGATVDHPDPIRWGGNPYPPLEDLQPAHRYCQGLQGAAIANAVQGLGPGSRGGNPTTWQPRKARKAPQRPPKAGGPPTADPTPKRSESGPDAIEARNYRYAHSATCQWCGCQFHPWPKSPGNYCSRECSADARTTQTTTWNIQWETDCAICRDPITATTTTTTDPESEPPKPPIHNTCPKTACINERERIRQGVRMRDKYRNQNPDADRRPSRYPDATPTASWRSAAIEVQPPPNRTCRHEPIEMRTDLISSLAPRSTPREELLPLSLPPGVSGGSAAVHPQLRPKSRGLLAVAADSAPLWLPAHSHGWDDESGPAAVPGLSPRPVSAVWPRFMTARHPDAAGSLYDQFDGWTRPRFGMHPKRTTGRRWWQELVARRALEVDAEGRLCWDTVCVSTPRQSGKSWLLREMCLARMALAERMGEVQTVVHTAVKLQHAFAVWNPAGRWARNRPEYTVRFANGEQQIEDPVDGSVWMIQAANEGLGVSLSVSLALVDEAWGVRRELVDNALVPTMAESEQPQLWVISTAGVPKAGEDMTDLVPGMRRLGAAREQREVLYVEWSAPRSADIDDPAVWRAASAHWDDRRLARVASARSKAETPKDTESFRRQWLNQWPDARAGADALVAGDVWARAGVSGLVPPRDRTVLGVSLDERTGLWPVAVAWVVDRAGSVPRVGVRLVGVFGSQDDAVAAVAGVRGQACQLVVPRWLTRNQVRVPGVRQVWQATDDEAVQALRLGVHRLQAGLLVHDPADEGTSAAVLDLPGARQSRRYDAGTLLLLCALFAARPADRAGSA